MPEKTCNRCGETKDVSCYEKNRGVCKKCRNGRNKYRSRISNTTQNSVELSQVGSSLKVATTAKSIRTLNDVLTEAGIDRSDWNVERQNVVLRTVNDSTTFQLTASLIPKIAAVAEFPVVAPIKIFPSFTQCRVNPKTNSTLKRALIIPDSQNGYTKDLVNGTLDPFHDRSAWDIALQVAYRSQPDVIVLLGDMLDLPEFSDKFLRSPEMQFTTQATILELGWTLARLRYLCPTSKIIFLEGNHEKRFENAVISNLAGAYNLRPANVASAYPAFSVPSLLGLETIGVEYIGTYPDSVYWLSPNLACMHGDVVKSTGGETAKAVLSRYLHSLIYGHIHRHELVGMTVHGSEGVVTRYAGSPGTITRIDGKTPGVNKRPDWQQGLFEVRYNDEQHAINPIQINNGVAIYEGEILKGNFDVEALRKDTGCERY